MVYNLKQFTAEQLVFRRPDLLHCFCLKFCLEVPSIKIFESEFGQAPLGNEIAAEFDTVDRLVTGHGSDDSDESSSDLTQA